MMSSAWLDQFELFPFEGPPSSPRSETSGGLRLDGGVDNPPSLLYLDKVVSVSALDGPMADAVLTSK